MGLKPAKPLNFIRSNLFDNGNVAHFDQMLNMAIINSSVVLFSTRYLTWEKRFISYCVGVCPEFDDYDYLIKSRVVVWRYRIIGCHSCTTRVRTAEASAVCLWYP